MHIQKLPKIDKCLASLSLAGCQEKQVCPTVQKGMFSMMQGCTSENTKLKQESNDLMKCNRKCPLEQGSAYVLDLDNFKQYPCTNKQQHNQKQCPYFHGTHDQRRPGGFYKQELCPFIIKNQRCPYGYDCCHAHNQVELNYQIDYYKTVFCPLPENCCYGQYCPMAHNEYEIRTLLIHNFTFDYDFYMFHYKTVKCPYLTNHDNMNCVYWHDNQDYRRKIELSPQICQCNDQNCQNCHNEYEYYYHPLIYKTIECAQPTSCNMHCPCYHDEKRDVGALVNTGIFKIVQRNRPIKMKQDNKLPKIKQ